MNNEKLIKAVIEQIKKDFEMGDETAIFELLSKCSKEHLEGFLSEV